LNLSSYLGLNNYTLSLKVEKSSIHGNINSNSDYISLEVKILLFKTAGGNKFPGEQAIVCGTNFLRADAMLVHDWIMTMTHI